MKPPITAPTTTIRFYLCAFQSNLKKSALFPAPHIVHMVRKFADIPKFLPTISSKNITRAIIGPATYQGQGSYIKFIVFLKLQRNIGFSCISVTLVTLAE